MSEKYLLDCNVTITGDLMFYVTNQGHNFYMTEKGFKTVSKILNLILIFNLN